MTGPSPWWRADVYKPRLPILRTRARIKSAIRQHLLAEGFDEVETPILQVSPGNETHIAAFATRLIGDDARSRDLYLHTSPEFTCKKLLAAGLSRIFTFAPVFRNRERGRLHHPEFQMLEWYRSDASLAAMMVDCVSLLRIAAETAGTRVLRHGTLASDAFATPDVVTVSAAFARHAGIDLDAMLPPRADAFTAMAAATRALSLRVSDDDTWSDLFSKILSAAVEPKLGLDRPLFLTRYPVGEAALARPCEDDPRFAARFELYACGVELANAFDELCDPIEQRRRFETAEAERRRIYGEAYPIDEDFLVALATMPPACGIALGFDRLVMLATGAARIEEVLWAPVAGPGS